MQNIICLFYHDLINMLYKYSNENIFLIIEFMSLLMALIFNPTYIIYSFFLRNMSYLMCNRGLGICVCKKLELSNLDIILPSGI